MCIANEKIRFCVGQVPIFGLQEENEVVPLQEPQVPPKLQDHQVPQVPPMPHLLLLRGYD